LAVCIELSATPHGGKPRLTRHVYEIDWQRWPLVAPAPTEHCRQELAAACFALLPKGCRRFTYEWSALCSGAKSQEFINLGGNKGEIKSEAL
jgi:hypothetical protein